MELGQTGVLMSRSNTIHRETDPSGFPSAEVNKVRRLNNVRKKTDTLNSVSS